MATLKINQKKHMCAIILLLHPIIEIQKTTKPSALLMVVKP